MLNDIKDVINKLFLMGIVIFKTLESNKAHNTTEIHVTKL